MSDTILVERTVVCRCGDELQPDDGAICGACLQPELAAAEERGRRSGVEEARQAVCAYGGRPECGCSECHRILALAPRDSGKGPDPLGVAELFDPAGDEE